MTSTTNNSDLQVQPVRKRWAFLVGINRYTRYDPLKYCVDDVIDLQTLLLTAGYEVTCLHDGQGRETEDGNPNPYFPTEKNIRGELKRLCNTIKQDPDAGANDLLLVYFACHGKRDEQDIPRLIANDTQFSLLDEAISVSEIENRMEESGAGCRVLMLDACHIGLGQAGTTGRGTADSALLKRIHEHARGYVLLTASTNRQEAKEWNHTKHGIFSYHVLDGLSGKAAPESQNYVTVNDIAGYVSLRIRDWAYQQGIEQEPCQRVEGNQGGFILIPEDCQDKVTALCLADPSEMVPAALQTVGGRGSSPEASRSSVSQVIECLWSLDCDPQCRDFRDGIPRTRRATAFVVQARDLKIQKWLVKRLVNQIPNVANARVFAFKVPRHDMGQIGGGVDNLWASLADNFNCSAEPNTVIGALIQIYRTKPIIVAMYGWSRRLKQLQEQILEQFWKPLVEAVGAMDQQPTRSRLILFLAEGPAITEPSVSANATLPKPAIPIRLEPLTEIQPAHVQQWMDSDTVYPLLSQYIPEINISNLIDEQILTWSSDPVEVIQEICYIFELDIEDIHKEWELAG